MSLQQLNASATALLVALLIIAAGSALGATVTVTQRVTVIKEPLPLAEQLRIWQCRQKCYHQALLQPTLPGLCHTRPDCFMCHDYCRVLVVAEWSLARSMCADRIFCSRGCRTACAFHQLHTARAAPFASALNKP
ncbi:uncharacterized protein LOC6565883 [Drosophila grimshawi]|uniref:GH24168 n=1 Tax=Drosophila grimshawi TaxID=7222 RepID=B4JNB6_DROGR|nr:uncharacterized protein LOC6565883 [Drosophila grimshawi]EDV92209.1 GH24168 [Drosophila grimshawi]